MENKYQVMPPLSDEEYEGLKGDIAENGVQVPVVLDADGNIIDGYHRVRARQELNAEGHDLDPYPEQIRSELTTDAEKRDLAWRLNMQRRHLNQAQKRDAIVAKLKETPHWADNRLAQLLGVDHKTVRNVRTSLEARNELPRLELLEGKDGKRYPRERPGDTMQIKFGASASNPQERAREERIKVQVKDLEDEEFQVIKPLELVGLEEAAARYGTPTQTHARAVWEKMRELANVVGGYEDKIKSEAGPEAVAEAVVGLLSEWIESFVPMVEAKLEGLHTDDQ